MNAARIAAHFLWAKWRWHTLGATRLVPFHDRRARQVVGYAARHAPFYRDHWAGHDLADWRTLPTVDKQSMMANFDHFNTRGISGERALSVALAAERSRQFDPQVDGLTVGLSSGTSGHRGLFLVSPEEQAAWAGTILARALPSLRRGGYRVALFLRSNSNLYEEVGSQIVTFRYFDLMLPLDDVVPQLNSYRPDIVIGPASLLGMLARAREAGDLRITPERLIAVAEVLERPDKQRLEQVFSVPVHEIYQATEGLLAVSCSHGSLHIQEDVVAVQLEPLGDGRATPIVTDLWRTVQPIIRYRLNDVLQLRPGLCGCGSDFRVIDGIEGRRDDICYFARPDGTLRPFFPDTIRRMVLLSSDQLLDYQAIQERPGQLRVQVVIAATADFEVVAQDIRRQVVEIVADYGCEPPEVEVGTGLPGLTAGSKRRRVVRGSFEF